MNYFFYLVIGFICGGTLLSYRIPLIFKKINIVEPSDDQNRDTANAVKHAGVAIGMLCLLCDLLKGYLPVYLSRQAVSDTSPAFGLIIVVPVLAMP